MSRLNRGAWAPIVSLAALAVTLAGGGVVIVLMTMPVPHDREAPAPVVGKAPEHPAVVADPTVVVAEPLAARPAIAVLAFTGVGPAEQISEQLRNELARKPGVTAARAGSDAQRAGVDTRAPYALAATVSVVGPDAQVNARVVATASGAPVWTHTINGPDDAPELADRVADEMVAALSAIELARTREIPPNSTVAFDNAAGQPDFDRTDAQVVRALGALSRYFGRYGDAQRLFTLVRELDPFSTVTNNRDLAGILVTLGRYSEAVPLLQGCVRIEAHQPDCLVLLTAAYAALGQLDTARATAADLAAGGYSVTAYLNGAGRQRDMGPIQSIAAALRGAGLPD